MKRTAKQVAAAIASRYARIARLDGWAEAHDDVTGELVVYNETLGRHYTGPDAWRLAALHDEPENVAP